MILILVLEGMVTDNKLLCLSCWNLYIAKRSFLDNPFH